MTEKNIHDLCGTPPPEKPTGATHLFNAVYDDPGSGADRLTATLDALDANPKTNPDPTDKINLTNNKYDGPPRGGWKGVTIHMEVGYHDSSVAWLKDPRSRASAHWCTRRDGFHEQLVYENDRSWHAGTAGDSFFGLEHEGGCGTGVNGDIGILWTTPKSAKELLPTDKMLQGSTDLVAYLVVKYDLKVIHVSGYLVRTGPDTIAGHDQMANNNHFDPGPYFPWTAYMATLKKKIAIRRGEKPSPGPTPKPEPVPDEPGLVRVYLSEDAKKGRQVFAGSDAGATDAVEMLGAFGLEARKGKA